MKKLMLAATMLCALASGANADALNNLTIGALPNPVPQSLSNPCIICATMTQQPVGFGFNNFVSQGNDTAFNLFSSNITGAFANGDDINVTPYTGGQLTTFLQNLGDINLTFGVAIDINTAHGGETLEKFQLINLDAPIGSKIIFDFTGSLLLPDINNGNGKGDYLISGFDLSSVNIGDRLLFRAQWSGASDGGESFYLVPQLNAVPGPALGAGLPAALAALLALGWYRRKRTAP